MTKVDIYNSLQTVACINSYHAKEVLNEKRGEDIHEETGPQEGRGDLSDVLVFLLPLAFNFLPLKYVGRVVQSGSALKFCDGESLHTL